MSDAAALFCAALIAIVSSAAITGWLIGARPHWSSRRLIAISSAPFPVLIALPCVWLLTDSQTSSQSECGVDACGMASFVAIIGLLAALALYVAGALAAAAIIRWRR